MVLVLMIESFCKAIQNMTFCDRSYIQISDFGLAVTNGMHGKNNIKLSGTLGYVAPEYLLDGKTFTFPIYFW